jgi:hypothetical protein
MDDQLQEANQQSQQEFAQREQQQAPAIDVKDALAKLPKGFAVLEGVIKETMYMNPEKLAKRNQFLQDDSRKTERKDLLKKLEIWSNLLTENSNVSDMVTNANTKSATAEKLLKQNVNKVLEAAHELETAYTSMDLFYKNSGEKKIRNLSIVNASIDNLNDGDEYYDTIEREIALHYEALDLSQNYSLMVVPGYFGSNEKLARYGRMAYKNKVQLITDSSNEDTPDAAIDEFERQKFVGADGYRANVIMTANHLIMRDKHSEYGEAEQLQVSPASGYAGRVYATNMSQPVAGTKYGTIYNVGAVKYKLKQGELSKFDEIGLVPMVHEFGRVMPYSAKTTNNGDSVGMQTYSVVRVFDYIHKVIRHFLNQKTFEKNNTALEKEVREQITQFLDSIKGKDKLIEKFYFTDFRRDDVDPTKIFLDLEVTPYFPAKSFQVTIDGHKGNFNSQTKEK